MRTVKNQLRRLARSDGYPNENLNLLTALGPAFLQAVTSLDEELDDAFDDDDIIYEGQDYLSTLVNRAFGKAFSNYLTTAEMIEYLNSIMLLPGGSFHEMAKWHRILSKVDEIKHFSECNLKGEDLEVAYIY